VYAAAHDLPAGALLNDGDLMVVRVRLPATSLRHYLQPGPDRRVSGRVLTAPVRRDALVPAGLVLASSRDAGLVELPLQVEPGDMAQGLRPGDTVQVLAAYTDGARRGRAAVLLPSAEVVQVLQDPTGLTGTGQERGVQLRMPGDRAPDVAAAIATARIFVVKTPGPATDPAATDPAATEPPSGGPPPTRPPPSRHPPSRHPPSRHPASPRSLRPTATRRSPHPTPRWRRREGTDGDRRGRGGVGGGAGAGDIESSTYLFIY
jgi:hypothetical protein